MTAVQVGIIVVLVTAGVLLWRTIAGAAKRALEGEAEAVQEQVSPPQEPREPSGPVGPDGLIVLFADRFVDRMPRGKALSARARAYSPQTEEELDGGHWAQQILYATMLDLYEQGSIDFKIVDRLATLMPPYPQKTWELHVSQVGPMPESPISDALAVAFGLLRKKARGLGDEGQQWVTLDALIEQSLKTMRQEMSFWQRTGVYGDIRQYVESALIAQGYLIEPARPTWLDRVRSQRPLVHEEGLQRLEPHADDLESQIQAFRLRHGGNLLPEDPHETEALRQVDSALLCPAVDAPEIPLDEVLRISIYETLMAIRQLEPSGDAGV